MLSRGALLLLALLLAAPPGLGQGPGRRRRPPPPQSLLEKVAAPAELRLPELAGRWFLVGMASRCSFLADHSHRLEATAMTVTIGDGQSLDISTFRKLDRMCWEIRQRYLPAQARGHFLLKGRGSKVDVVVGDTDHSSYAILYYQKGRSISVKLYGRSSQVSDAVIDKFEQHLKAVDLSEDVTYYFPTYGFCDSADEFHILDALRTMFTVELLPAPDPACERFPVSARTACTPQRRAGVSFACSEPAAGLWGLGSGVQPGQRSPYRTHLPCVLSPTKAVLPHALLGCFSADFPVQAGDGQQPRHGPGSGRGWHGMGLGSTGDG